MHILINMNVMRNIKASVGINGSSATLMTVLC
jgi:hypothetical protein